MAKPGPKPREFTKQERMLVTFMAVAAVPQKRIAKALEISVNTLEKHFSDELTEGADKLNAQVVGALFKSAIEGNVSAQIFWLKTRLGWREIDLNIGNKIDNITITLGDFETPASPPAMNGSAIEYTPVQLGEESDS